MDMRSNPEPPPGSAKALVRGLALIDLLATHPSGLRLNDIVTRGAIPKGTALRLLDALLASRVVQVDAHGVYRLGAQCAVWGSIYLGTNEFRDLATDVLTGLAEEIGETCHLGILEGDRVLYIDKVDSPHAVRMVSRIGGTNPLYTTALGKAMLAHLGDQAVESVIAGGLTGRTENSITEPELLRRDLALTQRRGYAVDDVENEEGVRCIGAAVFDHHGQAVASISVAGPAYRVTRQRIAQIGPEVRRAAAELSLRLGYVPVADASSTEAEHECSTTNGG